MAVVLLLATLAPGCRTASPEEQLTSAVERTLEDSFTYVAALEGERAAEGGEGTTGTVLRGVRVDGLRADDRWSVSVGVLGFDIVDVRIGGPELRWVRFGAADVLRLLAGDPELDPSEVLVGELEGRGVDEETREVVASLMRGTWLRVEGPLSGEDLDRALGIDSEERSGPSSSIGDVLGGDLETFVEEYVEVRDVEERRGDQHFDVLIDTRGLGEQLAQLGAGAGDIDPGELPEQLPGSAIVRAGLLHEVVVALTDQAETAESANVRMRLQLLEHGEAEAPPEPEDTRAVPSERFIEALSVLAEVFGGGLPALPGGGAAGGGSPGDH